jgi:hypothetical protein
LSTIQVQVDLAGATTLFLGAPRTFRLLLTADF